MTARPVRKKPADALSRERAPDDEAFYGFRPLPKRGKPVTNELIDRLREDGPY